MSNITSSKKVIIVGDGGVGKSALVKKMRFGDFVKPYYPTLGAELHPVNYNDHTFNFWDTAGQKSSVACARDTTLNLIWL